MLLILIFCLPLKLLIKNEISFGGIETGIYLYGLKIIDITFDISKNTFSINKRTKSLSKSIKKLFALRKKQRYKYKVNPKIISDLDLRFFLNRRENTDASGWAIQNALYKSFPERFKISLKKSHESSITFSIYGFFTIFQIISKIIANTKRR